MEITNISRWDLVPPQIIGKRNPKYCLIVLSYLVPMIAGLSWVVSSIPSNYIGNTDSASDLAGELRAAVTNLDTLDALGSSKSMAALSARVERLEAENQRLTADMRGLIDQDGAIDRLVTHVRALHAQNEATRRDVVGALMAPLPESDPTIDPDGRDPSIPMPMEEESSPFLSKAKHTIVTPTATAPEAAVAVPEAKRAKGKAKVVKPDEGKTN